LDRALLLQAGYDHELVLIRRLLSERSIPADNETALEGLDVAIGAGLEDVVDVYLNVGLNLNSQSPSGFTALTHAARAGRIRVVHTLLSAGCDVNTADSDGMTPLHHAALGQNVEVAILLVQRGADPTLRNSIGQTPLDVSKWQPFRVAGGGGIYRRLWAGATTRLLERITEELESGQS
jgi:tankyrase